MKRIYAISDTHGMVDYDDLYARIAASPPDVLVHAGDIQTAYVGEDPESSIISFFDFVERLRGVGKDGVQVVATLGNHDTWLRDNPDVEKPDNLHILVEESDEVCGLRFYGTPRCPPINGKWAFEAGEEEIYKRLREMPRGVDIMISHSPPKGTDIRSRYDVSLQHDRRYWKHLGSMAIRRNILWKRPKVVICGHIHSGDHSPNYIGGTAVMNCSLLNENYNRAYGIAKVTFIGSKIGMRGG